VSAWDWFAALSAWGSAGDGRPFDPDPSLPSVATEFDTDGVGAAEADSAELTSDTLG